MKEVIDMSITIRSAKLSDAPAIIKLLNEVLEIHAAIRPDIFVSGTTKYSLDELSAIINNPETPILVAVNNEDKVIGYGFCVFQIVDHPFMVYSKTLYIDDICIDQNYRQQHIGSQIFATIKQFAIDKGCDAITLNVWEGNDKAKSFYQHMGMKIRKTNMELMLKKEEL